MAAIVVLAKQKGRFVNADIFFSLFNENCFRGKEEIAELEAAFRRADINGDGKVKKPM